MPTLINELSSHQRSWIFETFGNYGEDELSNGEASSDDLESHFIKRHRNNETSTPIRRNSNDDSINYNDEPSPTPYISIPPFPVNTSTDSPPISGSDHQGVESHDNRNSIFRRSIGSTNTANSSKTSSGDGDGEGQPSPTSIQTIKIKPHPGSIWSPLHEKTILTTPHSSERPVYRGSNNNCNYGHGASSSPPNAFIMFPRPPFPRSINHPLIPIAAATTMPDRVLTTTTLPPTLHHPINDDAIYYHHHRQHHQHHRHHHHLPPPPPPPHHHLHPHHHPYAMRPAPPNHHNHPSATLIPSNAPIIELNHNHRNSSTTGTSCISHTHTQHHHNDASKPIIFPHSDDKLTWQQSFENLKIYKRIYGDCNVPQKYKINVKLGGWVNKQRKKKKNPTKYGKLTEEQIARMEEIGFKWIVESVQET